jgi:YihY family inner membrane protein
VGFVPNGRAALVPFTSFTNSLFKQAITAISDALNHAYGVKDGRSWWKIRGTAILLTVGFSLFIIAAVILLMFGPHLGRWMANAVGLGSIFELAWNILRWPVIVALLMVALAILYDFAPDVEQEWRWVTPGAVFAAVGLIIASLGFSYYVNNFASYNKTYGSIGVGSMRTAKSKSGPLVSARNVAPTAVVPQPINFPVSFPTMVPSVR